MRAPCLLRFPAVVSLLQIVDDLQCSVQLWSLRVFWCKNREIVLIVITSQVRVPFSDTATTVLITQRIYTRVILFYSTPFVPLTKWHTCLRRFAKNLPTKARGHAACNSGHIHRGCTSSNSKSTIWPTFFQVILLPRANSSQKVCFVSLVTLYICIYEKSSNSVIALLKCANTESPERISLQTFVNACSNAAAELSGYKVNAGIIYWDIKGDRLSVGLAATGYYVGFGINDKGPRMSGADIAICREYQVGTFASIGMFRFLNYLRRT